MLQAKAFRGPFRHDVKYAMTESDLRLVDMPIAVMENNAKLVHWVDVVRDVDIDVDVGESVIGYLGLTETCPVDDNLVPKSGSAGAFAEYCVVPASRVAIIPGSSDPRAMAGLPLAGLTAYQALFTGAGKVSQQGSHSSLFLSPSHAHTLSLSLSLKCLSSPSNRSPCRAPLLVTSRRATRC